MAHPMSEAWLDWKSMNDEPRSYELILYRGNGEDFWVGNHPAGHARGLWYEGHGGGADGRRPEAWARIPRTNASL